VIGCRICCLVDIFDNRKTAKTPTHLIIPTELFSLGCERKGSPGGAHRADALQRGSQSSRPTHCNKKAIGR
jgi:hypothetical protein